MHIGSPGSPGTLFVAASGKVHCNMQRNKNKISVRNARNIRKDRKVNNRTDKLLWPWPVVVCLQSATDPRHLVLVAGIGTFALQIQMQASSIARFARELVNSAACDPWQASFRWLWQAALPNPVEIQNKRLSFANITRFARLVKNN